MHLPFDFTAITQAISGVIYDFLHYSVRILGVRGLRVPLWLIALIVVLAFAIYSQTDKTR